MLDKLLDICTTVMSGVIVFAVFEYLRNIKPKNNNNDKRKRNANDS